MLHLTPRGGCLVVVTCYCCCCLQFFSVSPYLDEHPEYAEADGAAPLFGANMAYLLHNEAGARFYFVKGAFNETKVRGEGHRSVLVYLRSAEVG
jgi:hypothetical protein